MFAIIALLAAGIAVVPGPSTGSKRPSRLQSGEQPSSSLNEGEWVARRRRKKKRKQRKAPPQKPMHLTQGTPTRSLKLRKRVASLYTVAPGAPIEMSVEGPGLLIASLYQALRGGDQAESLVQASVDGGPAKRVALSLVKHRSGNLKPDASAVSKQVSLRFKIEAGSHRIVLSSDAAVALAELMYFSDSIPKAVPILADLPPMLGDAADDIALLGGDSDTTAGVNEAVKLLQEHATAQIARLDGAEADTYYLVDESKPYSLEVRGPGVLTVRLHRVMSDPAQGETGLQISILENDVLLRSVEMRAPISSAWEMHGENETTAPVVSQLSSPKVYKLEMAGKQSRFDFLLADAEGQRLAVRHSFEATVGAEDSGMMDLGGDFGLTDNNVTAPTVFIEVDIRETVIEKVVRVGSLTEETLGASVGVGATVPTWGGGPSPVLGIDLQYILPLQKRVMALGFEAQLQRHSLASETPDARQAIVAGSARLWVVPVRIGPTYRLDYSDSLRLLSSIRAVIAFMNASTSSQGAEHSGTTSTFGVGGSLGGEVRIGAGWFGVEAGYTWAPAVNIKGVVRGFSPGGVDILTRFRFII